MLTLDGGVGVGVGGCGSVVGQPTWDQNATFNSGDQISLQTARANLNHAIKQTKHVCREFSFFQENSNTENVGEYLSLRAHKMSCRDDVAFLGQLNSHFGLFEVQNSTSKSEP